MQPLAAGCHLIGPMMCIMNNQPDLSRCLRGLIPILLFLLSFSSTAQPVPCGPVPDMTPTCIDACVICDINGYTGINDDTQQGQAPPGFCTTQIHHMQWIAFIAGSTNLTITVKPSNCNGGQGLEIGIYRSLNCSTFQLVSNCDTDVQQGETGVFTNTVPLVIGQYYYFVMDGNQGDICNYTINVTSGSTLVPPLPPAGAVQGPDEICQFESATFAIPEIVGAVTYKWTLDGQQVAGGFQTPVTFNTPGDHEVCVLAYNVCDTVAPSCKTVRVNSLKTTSLQYELCSGTCLPVADTTVCDPGNYIFHFQTTKGCDSTVNVLVSGLPTISTNLNVNICSTDSLLAGDTWYYPPGVFTEVQTAANGCDSIINLSLNSIICEISGASSVQDVACNGTSKGTITFSVQNGTPGFTYAWKRLEGWPSGNGSISALGEQKTITGLPAGEYLITVSDNFGNDVILTAEVSEPAAIALTESHPDFNGFDISCYGLADGSISMTASGGTPGYTWTWNTGDNMPGLDSLKAGSYVLTLTDAAGCTETTSVTLTQPQPLVLNPSFINPGCEGFDTGIISAESVTGGVPPYQYSLSGGDFTSAGIYPGLTGGPWSLTVMDSNHCTDDTLAVLVAAEIPVAEAGEDVNLPLGCPHQLQAFSTVTPAIISWTNSGSLSCSDCLNPVAMPFNTTEYTLEVTSGDGCVARDSLTVRVVKDRNIYAPNVFSPNNDGLNDYFNLYTDKGARQIRYLGIYSRWGELVFEKFNFQPNELSEGWDGLFEGRVMPPGVFVWTAEVEYLDDEVVRIQGDVTIVR